VAHDRITLHEAAARLGVHYMTVYRYVRTGRLPATRDGVQWLVDPADLARVTPGRQERGRARAAAPSTLAARLIAGDEAGSWSLLEQAMGSGAEPADVLLDVVVPALAHVGQGWADGELDVADEHCATAVAQRLVGRLGPQFARRGRKRGTIVVGAPAGEEHGLPSAIVADLLRGARFDVLDLGADTPPDSFAVAAAQVERLVAVLIGVTTPGNDEEAARALKSLRERVDVPLFVGGAAILDEAHARRLGADGWTGRTGRDLLAAVERAVG
jgi:excisionase family DNA binding protein